MWLGLQTPLFWVDPQMMKAGFLGPRVSQGHNQAFGAHPWYQRQPQLWTQTE